VSDLNPEPTVHGGAVDTHCHLFLLDSEPPAVVEAARASGVDRIICVGIDVETSRRSLELADSIPGVFATAGMHPHDASAFDAEASARIEELLHDPRVVGVGECGLDYFRMHSPIEDQIRTLKTHISLSNESSKPMVVHVRDAWEDTLRVLGEGSAEHVVIHCFSGDADIARECAARGYHLSFAANITYPKNDRLRQAAAAVSQDRLLTETDSPFLSPQSTRGRPNHPGNVQAVIAELATARNERPDDLAVATGANANAAFSTMK
jgi:TatD DNase family protein